MSTSAGKKKAAKAVVAKKKPVVKKAAKAVHPAKKAAHKPQPDKKAAPAKKIAAKKPSAKPAPKPMPKPSPRKPVAMPAGKGKSVPVKVTQAGTTPGKSAAPAGKPGPAAARQPAQAPAPSSVAAKAAPGPTLVPGAPLAVPAGVVPRKPGRGTPKYFVAPVQAPLPPPTSRFADRFAPPRPPTREMNKLDNDTPRERHKSDPKLANAWKNKAGRDLTDAEVLAMPDAEYMNEKQIDFFRVKLEALKNDLLSNAGETTEHLREDTSIVPDPADRATIEEEHALELRTRDRERKLLKKISQSLARLESGDYGFCDETGEPIGLGRLIARPTATLSLEAQQRRELKQKMFGD